MNYTVAQAAEYLAVSESRVRYLAKVGKLRGRKFGRAWQFTRAQLDRWKNAPVGKPGPKKRPSKPR